MPEESAEKRLQRTGGNIGNQIIAHGLLSALRYDEVSWDHSLGSAYVDSNFDIIVVAAANFLFEGFDFSGMADFIEATNLPCVMVGLGAQSSNFSTDINIQPGTQRLVQIVAERSTSIGVRGPFTADVLARLGIKNVQVVGCPSYYLTCQPELRFKERTPEPSRVVINGSRDVVRHSFDPERMKVILRRLMKEAVSHSYDFVAQTELDEIRFSEADGDSSQEVSFRNYESFFEGVATQDELRMWLRSHVRAFWDVEEWFKAMPAYDFIIGTRFHGAIAGIESGIPACVICHDTRTSEMCEFLGIPRLSLDEATSLDIRSIFDRIDMTQTQRRYRQLYPDYKDFLESNNLPHRLR